MAVSMNYLDLVLCDRPMRGPTTKQRLKIPRCVLTQLQKSFAARTITDWNSLPDSITSWLRYHPSEVSCLLYRAVRACRRAHLIAAISFRSLVVIIQYPDPVPCPRYSVYIQTGSQVALKRHLANNNYCATMIPH